MSQVPVGGDRAMSQVPVGGESLTHLDAQGRARMVNVTGKEVTVRRAVARCVVRTIVGPRTVLGLTDPAGDAVAKVAGIQAAKRTAELIPLCHPLLLSDIRIEVVVGERQIEVTSMTEVVDRTGVEMEALTACAFTGLSLVTALRASDPCAYIDELALWRKTGGRSGTWQRQGTRAGIEESGDRSSSE